MKPFFLALFIVTSLFSCKNAGNDKKTEEPDSAQAAGTAALVDSAKLIMNNAILELRSKLESQNRNRIAELMDFPLADTIMNVHVDDAGFLESYRTAGNKLSKAMFIKYYSDIAKDTYLDEITKIFSQVPMDSLAYTNELDKEVKQEMEPCTKFYSIEVQQNYVRLTYRTHANKEYVPKETQDTPDTAGCEYAVSWIFRLEGDKLRLFRQGAAG
jgi:hypothetical protein